MAPFTVGILPNTFYFYYFFFYWIYTSAILLKKYTTGAQLKVVIFKIWSSWIRIRMETQLTVSISRIGTFSIRIFFKSVCSIDLKIVSTAQPISHEAILNLLVVISPMYLVPSQYFQAKIILILDMYPILILHNWSHASKPTCCDKPDVSRTIPVDADCGSSPMADIDAGHLWRFPGSKRYALLPR